MEDKKNKENTTNESFDKIADVMNTSFEGNGNFALDDVKNAIDKKKELMKKNVNDLSLKDAEYMREEIVSILAVLETGLDKLVTDLKAGSPPRLYEVLATMSNSKIAAVKELRELNKTIVEVEKKLDPNHQEKVKNVTVNITSSDLQEMVKNATDVSQLKEIDGHFDIKEGR